MTDPTPETERLDVPRVAVVVPRSYAYSREVIYGVGQYAQAESRWSLLLFEPSPATYSHIERLEPDGVIAHVIRPEIRERLLSWRDRLVNVSSYLPPGPLARVVLDDEAIGRAGAEHLLQRGFRRLAYTGIHECHFSFQRQEGFARAVRQSGADLLDPPPRMLHSLMPDPTQVARQLRLFREWVLQAGRPVGLMACNDDQAVRYASACHHVGLRVPEDVAVLGVDDDEVLCESCLPPLSSVRCQGDRVGWTAAAVLDRMLKGQAAPDRLKMVPPVGVRTRPSTEMLAIEDPIVADALGYIRRHAGEPIDAREVMAEVPISRRMLEIRFKRHTGMTLCQAIRQQHLCRARDLLTDTDLSILEVALRSGFANSQRLNETFRKAHGLSPSAWRTRHRGLR